VMQKIIGRDHVKGRLQVCVEEGARRSDSLTAPFVFEPEELALPLLHQIDLGSAVNASEIEAVRSRSML
jgi:hypothetical protein